MKTIYTDGACKGNPGPGGWGALIICADAAKELFGGEPNTTNNRMELLAVIRALESINDRTDLAVYTDSQYVQKGITEWITGWQKRGWKTSANKPVKNADLWRELLAQSERHNVQWHWVKGHAGHPGNERADELANAGVELAGQ
ncbi:MAG: ribonuclease HI [Burkholderiaceae bacterium]